MGYVVFLLISVLNAWIWYWNGRRDGERKAKPAVRVVFVPVPLMMMPDESVDSMANDPDLQKALKGRMKS